MIVFAKLMHALKASSRLQEDKIVLLGDIVTMNATRDVIRDGKLCILGNSISYVLGRKDSLPNDFVTAVQVETDGTIYPGLIDLHNHLTYNMLPLWTALRKYENRNTWREHEDSYKAEVAKPASLLARNPDRDYRRAIVRFAECRNLFGGVSSGQGMSMSAADGYTKYFRGLMRNVEQPLDGGWPAADGQVLDYLPSEIESKLAPELKRDRPFFYHLSEGTDLDARQRFLDLRQKDGTWVINKSLICIHCVGLEANDFDQLRDAAGVVWSPTSNLLLYGQTSKIAEAKARNVPIALGADWGPSGCKNLLGELKVARAVSQHVGELFTNVELVNMVTGTPAKLVGWDRYVGSIGQGQRADLLILVGRHEDPYSALIDARETTIRALLIDGRIRMGEASGFTVGTPQTSEAFSIGGKNYLLDLVETRGRRNGWYVTVYRRCETVVWTRAPARTGI